MLYAVIYRTPVAEGRATVEASGIFDAMSEARTAVHILAGHDLEAIDVLQVIDPACDKTLWSKTRCCNA